MINKKALNQGDKENKLPHERSGNYRIVKICLNEIEAMKELGFSRKTILERLEFYFGNSLTPDQLSSNINRIRKEIHLKEKGSAEKIQTRKDRIAEIVNNPELIHGNLYIYQQIIDPQAGGFDNKGAGGGRHGASRSSPTAGSGAGSGNNSGRSVATSRRSQPAVRQELTSKEISAATDKIWSDILVYVRQTNTKYREEDVPHIKETISQKINAMKGKLPLEIIEEHLRSFFN